ncbi:hypothetical protein [Pseudomonas fluorescens]
MRDVLNVARHFLTGKLPTEHAVNALRGRPMASNGKLRSSTLTLKSEKKERAK